MTPRVSVIIRTYNRAHYLEQAIDSVLAQTYRDFELIVIDDGSTDATHQALTQYAERLSPIYLSHTGNPATAFNAGVRAGRGELIAFLDDDDIWFSDKLEAQVGLLDRTRRAGFAYGNVRLLYPDGQLSAPMLAAQQIINGSALRTIVQNMCVHPSTLLFRKSCLGQIELPDEKHPVAETFLFSLRLAQLSEAVCHVEPVALIRRHSQELSDERGLANYQAAVFALESLLQDRTLPWLVRFEAHKSVARYQSHIAKTLIQTGRRKEAWHHALRALWRYPMHRPAWRWALRCLP
jgi:glycosyltransferase involved in cell wall biosynthesis